MLTRNAWFVASLFVLTGCAAAYSPPPLTAGHPAHLEAVTAPEPPRSTTLAYGLADIPSPQPASSMAQRGLQHDVSQGMQHGGQQGMPHGTQQGMHSAQPSEPGGQHTVVGEGKVVAVVPGSSQIVVDHGAITGFMDAMTMGYQVQPPSLLEGMQAGDRIRFTIDTQRKAIVAIEPLPE